MNIYLNQTKGGERFLSSIQYLQLSADSTVIIFTQNIGQEIHLIDMYINQGEGLNHYSKVVQDKATEGNWTYGDHCAPHDIRVRELGTGAQSRLQIARELGIDFLVVPNLPIAEGIELTRGIFPRLWFDSDKCSYLIKALENYHSRICYSKIPICVNTGHRII